MAALQVATASRRTCAGFGRSSMGWAMAASIFISFAGADLKTATEICQALEARGFSCWLAHRDIPAGENFQIAIVRAIRAAQAMVLLYTQHANHSDEVAKELALASQSRLRVAPLRLEAVIPNEALAYEFATRQWIDFTGDREAAMALLCQRLTVMLADETAVEAPMIAPPPLPRRRKPARWPLVAGALALAIAGAAGVWAALRNHDAPHASAAAASAPPPKPPPETNDVPF